jgi:PAS domain S-box-containing protein
LLITNPLLRQLKESEQYFRGTFEQAAVGIAHVMANGHFIAINQRFCDIVGYTRDELLGRTFQEITYLDDVELNLKYKEQLMAGTIQTYSMEKRYLHKDGSPVWVNLTASLVRESSGEPKYLLGVVEDISQRKQAEERLQEYSERLEEMVEERTRDLAEAQEQLVRREKLAVLGQLAGSVAHELRHPLGVLTNAVYFLNLTLTQADETTKEYLDMMSAEIRKSEKIISDLLNFSRTKSSEKKEIAVSELVGDVLAKHPPPEQIEVSNQIDTNLPPIVVDPQQIEQVITNLIINAYQAMPEGGSLTVTATTNSQEPSEDGNVTVSFIDTGTGIPPDHMDKLFEPLFTTKSKGVGLGLVVSKNLTEMNDGTIKVDSEEGKGSTFTVKLPAKEGGDFE